MKLLEGSFEEIQKNMQEEAFVFELAYVPFGAPFKEIDRFLWESRHERTRFKNRYEGPVLVGITEWNRAGKNKYFDAFLYFLKDLSITNAITVFSEEQVTGETLAALRRILDVEPTALAGARQQKPQGRTIGFCPQEERSL